MKIGFQTHLLARLRLEAQFGVMNVLPGEEIHETISGVVRWEEVLKRFDVAIGRIAVATGIVVLKEHAWVPRTLKIVAAADVRGERREIEISYLPGLEGKLAFIFEPVELFRVAFHPRPKRNKI